MTEIELVDGILYWIREATSNSGVRVGEYYSMWFYLIGYESHRAIRLEDAEVLGKVEFIVPEYAKGFGYG